MNFDWQCHPEAEAWLKALLAEYKQRNLTIAEFEQELYEKSSTHLFDWIDHFTVESEREIQATGYVEKEEMFIHPDAKLPSVIISERVGVALKVDSIADFLMVHGKKRKIEGAILSTFRRCLVTNENGVHLWVVERRGKIKGSHTSEEYLTWSEQWQTRDRDSISEALELAQKMVSALGQDAAAWIVCECERKYWQARNTAAQIQKNRQDRLGMGWANHDHHTFRSSRRHFAQLVQLFEMLGFSSRERFYAGEQAGWGAQVMENTNCGLVLFLDVDLAPDELEFDFAHLPLRERETLGTVGLWCALHGDSILKAGMHHLEAQFDFDKLREDLASQGIGMMNPFSSFSYLRQAFTKPEIWPVASERIENLLKEGFITKEEGDRFLEEGAVGSHLENLQRKEGYKGFNKDNVSLIMRKTDPRTLHQ